MIKNKKLLALIMVACMCVFFIGCNVQVAPSDQGEETVAPEGTETTPSEEVNEDEVVTLKVMTYWVGESTSAEFWSYMVAEFEKQYPNIKLQIEEVPGKGNELEDKLKVLIGAGDFPDISTVKTYDTVKSAQEAGLLVDLKPHIEADPEWAPSINDEINRGFNPVDGEWNAIVAQVRNSGYFYNKDIFEQAGVEGPAETWEEMWEIADKIKDAGYAPFALQGMDAGWLTNTWFMPILASQNETGKEMANTMFPRDFNTPEFIEAVSITQDMLVNYATPEMVGNVYSASAATFLTEQSAMIAQTPSFVTQITDPEKSNEGLGDRVGHALYPGNSALTVLGDAWVCGSNTPEKLEASLTFLKFMTDLEAQKIALEMADLTAVDTRVDPSELEIDPLLQEVIDVTNQAEYYVPSPHLFYSSALWPTLNSLYPSLAYEEITPEEFADTLTKDTATLVYDE